MSIFYGIIHYVIRDCLYHRGDCIMYIFLCYADNNLCGDQNDLMVMIFHSFHSTTLREFNIECLFFTV